MLRRSRGKSRPSVAALLGGRNWEKTIDSIDSSTAEMLVNKKLMEGGGQSEGGAPPAKGSPPEPVKNSSG